MIEVTPAARHDERSQYRRIAGRLRSDILEGIWRPDTRLKVRDLAAHYGVSPAPVRESLQQLQGEGLVVIEPHRGARVRPIDEATSSSTSSTCAKRWSPSSPGNSPTSASPHQIAVLEELQAQHDEAVERDDFPAAFVLNGRFHLLINSAARNPEALAVIDRHLSLTRALRLDCGMTPAPDANRPAGAPCPD